MTVKSKLRILINITLLHICNHPVVFSRVFKYYLINTNVHRLIHDTTHRVVRT